MRRIGLTHLIHWKNRPSRKPLLVRGARQVGKSFLIREFGRDSFNNVVELNFEMRQDLAAIFTGNLDPSRLIRDLKIATQQEIVPGQTLLFFDEIQLVPQALTALRYFYEKMPDLHVIAAGSLLEFAIEEVGIPVGRVESFYLYPMNFKEFLAARGKHQLIDFLEHDDFTSPPSDLVHGQLLDLVFEHLAVGGMPEAVRTWVDTQDIHKVAHVHGTLVETYRQDFPKYARRAQIKYVDTVFQAIPRLLGRKFVYAHIDPTIKARDLKAALLLLAKAGVAHIVSHSNANGLPLGAETKSDVFKVIFLDVGLAETMLGLKPGAWILDSKNLLINRGPIVESYVGQELLTASPAHIRAELFYWVREKATSLAEVDYLWTQEEKIIPIEVKSGSGRRGKSVQIMLSEKPHITSFCQVSVDRFHTLRNGTNIPLYGIHFCKAL